MEVELTEISPSKPGLVVGLAIGSANAHRFHMVVIPWSMLCETEILTEIDATVRRRLIEVWSGVDIGDPLF